LIEVNGEQPVAHVFDDIKRSLEPFMPKHEAPVAE
jgi:hypothetical protein